MEKLDNFGDSLSYLGQLGELSPRSPLNLDRFSHHGRSLESVGVLSDSGY